MAFVNPEILKKIFAGSPVAQEGAFDPRTPHGARMVSMMAGAGAGMSQAAHQPGADFSVALGGGASGMMQGQQQAQQQQYMQQQIEMQKQKMQREQARLKGFMDLVMGGQGDDWAGQVAAQLPQTPQLQTVPQGQPLAPQGGVQARPMPDMEPGFLSAQYESSGRGVGTISTGQDDPGGPSYGAHQMTAPTFQAFLQSPEGQPFAQHFGGGDITPGTPQFNQLYTEVAEGAGPAFAKAQKAFIDRTHFQPNVERAQRLGLPVDNMGVREALYSMGVQHSPAGNLQIMNDALARLPQDASPEEVVDALYSARTSYVSNVPGVPESAGAGRYQREREQALNLARGSRQVQPATTAAAAQAAGVPAQAPQQPQNGYQRASAGPGTGPAAGMTDTQRRILMALGPDAGMSVLAEQAFRPPTEQPAAVREALFMAGGDPDLARQIMLRDMTDTEKADFEKRIDAVMAANPGTTRGAATNFVLGVTGMDVSPNTGRVTRTNQLGGEAYEVPVQSQDQLPPIEPAGPTAWDLLDASNATGVQGGIAELGNRTLGQLGFSVGEDTTTARRYFQQLENDILRAFQESPRFAEGEAARIKEELQLGPNVLRSESTLRAGLQASASSLTTRLQRYRRAADNTRLGDTTRREAAEKADVIEWALARLGVPAEAAGTGGTVDFAPEDQALIDRWAQ